MKKSVFVFLVLAIASLTACGGSETDANPTAEAQATVYWATVTAMAPVTDTPAAMPLIGTEEQANAAREAVAGLLESATEAIEPNQTPIPGSIEDYKEQIANAQDNVQNIIFSALAFQGDAMSVSTESCSLDNFHPLTIDVLPFLGKQVTVDNDSIHFDWNGPQEAEYPVKIWASFVDNTWFEITICKADNQLYFNIEETE